MATCHLPSSSILQFCPSLRLFLLRPLSQAPVLRASWLLLATGCLAMIYHEKPCEGFVLQKQVITKIYPTTYLHRLMLYFHYLSPSIANLYLHFLSTCTFLKEHYRSKYAVRILRPWEVFNTSQLRINELTLPSSVSLNFENLSNACNLAKSKCIGTQWIDTYWLIGTL